MNEECHTLPGITGLLPDGRQFGLCVIHKVPFSECERLKLIEDNKELKNINQKLRDAILGFYRHVEVSGEHKSIFACRAAERLNSIGDSLVFSESSQHFLLDKSVNTNDYLTEVCFACSHARGIHKFHTGKCKAVMCRCDKFVPKRET